MHSVPTICPLARPNATATSHCAHERTSLDPQPLPEARGCVVKAGPDTVLPTLKLAPNLSAGRLHNLNMCETLAAPGYNCFPRNMIGVTHPDMYFGVVHVNTMTDSGAGVPVT